MSMRVLRVLSVVATTAVLAACGSSGADDDTVLEPEPGAGGSESESVELVGTTWTLDQATTAAGETATPEEKAFVSFTEDGRLEGNSGCNGYGGDAEIDGDQVELGPVLGTMRACQGAAGEIDRMFTMVLKGTITASVSGNELTLTNTDGATLAFTAESDG